MGRGSTESSVKYPPGVEVNPGIKGRIRISFMYKGVRCKETLNLAPTQTNIKYAGNLRAAIVTEIAKGTFDYAKHFPDSPRVVMFGGRRAIKLTVGEALDQHLASLCGEIASSTYRDYQSAVNYYLKPAFGDILLQNLTATEIKTWRASLLREPIKISPKRVNNILVPLRGALKDAFGDELISRNPTSLVKNLSVIIAPPDPFTKDELWEIINTATGQARNLFQFAFFTGLRTGELIALEWGDIDWNKNVVCVRRNSVRKEIKTTKTSAGQRDVLLLPQAREALDNQKEFTFLGGGRVFHNPRTNQPWETDAQIRRTSWEHILKKTGIRYRIPYHTRHTYASQLLSSGENPMWVAAQMGHRDWGLIRTRYATWIPSTDPTAGQKAGAFLQKPDRECPAGVQQKILD